MASPKVKAGGGEKAVWMPKYGRDFYNDENVLAMGVDLRGWARKGIYEFLLWKSWDEGSIPDNVAVLASMCGMPKPAFAKLWPAIAICWQPHPSKPGRLVQKRQERVRAASGELSRKMRELAEKRWADEETSRLASGQNVPTDRPGDAEPHATPHAKPHPIAACDSACEPASGTAMRAAMQTTDIDTGHRHRDSQTDRGLSSGARTGVPEIPVPAAVDALIAAAGAAQRAPA